MLAALAAFAAFAALGLQYYSLRFVDLGGGVKNVMKLTKSEITKLRHLEGEFGLNVASIGSPIGKVRIDEPFGRASLQTVRMAGYRLDPDGG